MVQREKVYVFHFISNHPFSSNCSLNSSMDQSILSWRYIFSVEQVSVDRLGTLIIFVLTHIEDCQRSRYQEEGLHVAVLALTSFY